ncbi:MAG TPA: CPBP family intramembrane glutamic endopeptidase [Anaerolineales bacterium]
MNTLSNFFERHSLILFFALTILLSFAITPLLSYAITLQILPPDVENLFVVLIPTLVAIFLTAISGGRKGISALLKQLVQWRVGFKWYAAALIVALAVRLSMSLLALALGWIQAVQIRAQTPVQLVLLFMIFYIAAALEELGWRGFALPKLLGQRSALFSALLIGVLWGTVHLALHLPGLMFAGWPWPATMLELIGISVVITWLFVNTRGSVVIVTLYHAAQNYFVIVNEGISGPQQLWLMVMSYAALVLILIALFGPALRRGASEHPEDKDEVQLVDSQVAAAKRIG